MCGETSHRIDSRVYYSRGPLCLSFPRCGCSPWTLGRVITDYATREFEFTLRGSKWLWKRDPPTDAHQIQLHSLRRMTTTDAIASFFFLAMITPEGSCAGEMTTNLSGLLESYHDVFWKPTGLPPSRAQDHSIHLVPGAQPVNVKPYRYPHFQKQVME